MMAIMLIPVSNAACVRIFSLVRKNKTDFRASMGNETLETLIILKEKNSACHEKELSNDLLKKYKSATVASLQPANLSER